MGCDIVVAAADGGAGRGFIFGKNSDRPADECQPLCHVPARTHRPGTAVRCQYVEIPQAPATLAVLGSRPWWLWGFEHGVNEAGVAVGNTALHTRDEVAATGLLGMDLVRLSLERSPDAEAARRVITALLAAHGQGGRAAVDTDRRYHNSFLIADRRTAWVLETSARHWVARRVRTGAAISNLATIGDDWDECSDGIAQYARDRGWWTAPAGTKLDFRAAFEDPNARPRAEGRYACSRRYLGRSVPPSVEAMKAHLRDHIEPAAPHPTSPCRPAVCMHPGESPAATAASMVVHLTARPGPVIACCALATPCTSPFLPVPVGVPLPPALATGDGRPSEASAWWRLRRLAEWVEAEPAVRGARVRRHWAAWEAALWAQALRDPGGAGAGLEATVEEMLARADDLLAGAAAPAVRRV